MARIKPRRRADGGITYRVEWVLGGGRASAGSPSQSESFTDENRAKAFKLDVEHSGHEWPTGWVKGRGYVTADRSDVPTETAFDEVAADYFALQATRVKKGLIKPYTLSRYKSIYRLHLEPCFASRPFIETETDQIEGWLEDLIETHSAKSIHNFHGLLYSIMEFGRTNKRLRTHNPCESIELPALKSRTHDVRQVRFLDKQEWPILRAEFKPQVLPFVDTLLATGARWGEVTGLRVGDITFVSKTTAHIHIVRAWSNRSPEDDSEIKLSERETRQFVLGPPKNGRSRHVTVSGVLVATLRSLADGRAESEYLFATRHGNPIRHKDFSETYWTRATVAASKRGLDKKDVTVHMLRHTNAVWALDAGLPVVEVSESLGHADITITLQVYAGVLNPKGRAVGEAKAMAEATASPAKRSQTRAR